MTTFAVFVAVFVLIIIGLMVFYQTCFLEAIDNRLRLLLERRK